MEYFKAKVVNNEWHLYFWTSLTWHFSVWFPHILFTGSYCCWLERRFLKSTRVYTVPKEIDFPRYNMKCSRENVILRGMLHVVSGFPLHFMLNRGNLDCFSNSVQKLTASSTLTHFLVNIYAKSINYSKKYSL